MSLAPILATKPCIAEQLRSDPYRPSKLSVVIDWQEESQVISPSRARGATALLFATGLGVAVTLSGCGAGQITHTSQKVSAIQGINVDAGDIAIRDAAVMSSANVKWAAGSDAPLSMVLVNGGPLADKLLKAESDTADSIELVAGVFEPAVEAEQEEEHATPSPTATPTPTTNPEAQNAEQSQAPSSAPPASENESDEVPAGSQPNITIEPRQAVPLTGLENSKGAAQYLVLKNLKSTINPGANVKVTLTFERAGDVELTLPVFPPSEPRDRTPLTHGTKEEH